MSPLTLLLLALTALVVALGSDPPSEPSNGPTHTKLIRSLFQTDTADKDLVRNLAVLAQGQAAHKPGVRRYLEFLLTDPNASYLARRLLELRYEAFDAIEESLKALAVMGAAQSVAEFMAGFVTCQLMDDTDDDVDSEDLRRCERLLEIVEPYCGPVSVADIPESVAVEGDLDVATLRFRKPGAVKSYIGRHFDTIRGNRPLIRTLLRCGVDVTLLDVLTHQLKNEDLRVLLPYLHGLQSGIRARLIYLLRDNRWADIESVCYDPWFRYTFTCQDEDDCQYLVDAAKRAIRGQRLEQLEFLISLPESQHWVTPDLRDALETANSLDEFISVTGAM